MPSATPLHTHKMTTGSLLALVLLTFPPDALAAIDTITCDGALFIGVFEAPPSAVEVNTTSLRREMKVVAPTAAVRAFLTNLSVVIGELIPRDRLSSGRINVTSTDYLPRFRLDQIAGASRVAKIRVRRYLEREQGRPLAESVFGQWPADLVKVEFKVDHHSEPGVVNKYTIVMKSSDVTLLVKNKSSYLAHRDAVLSRTRLLLDPSTHKHNNSGLAEHMILSLQRIYDEEDDLSPRLNIRYEREAYKIDIPDVSTGLNVAIQMTIDHDIQYRHPAEADNPSSGAGPILGSYPSDNSIVEIKIPLVFADLNHPFWSQSEAHRTLVREIRILQSHQVPWIPSDHGKLGAWDVLSPDATETL